MIYVSSDAGTSYDAPQHYGVEGILKLTKDQTQRTIINYSYFQPDGGAQMSSAPVERVYFVVKGSITIRGKESSEEKREVYRLGPGDIIYIAPGEERELTVNGRQPAEVLVFVVDVESR